MKVLWILNMVLPFVAKELSISTLFSGGWLVDYANQLAKDENVELATMTYANVDKPMDVVVGNIRNYIFPGAGKRLLFNSKQCLRDCQKVLDSFKPDIIHIHGTEYAIGYSMVKLQTNIPTVLTIQGILTRISEEYYGGLSKREIFRMSSIKDWLRLKSPYFAKKLFEKNAKREQYVLKNVKYVTGRTEWDKSVMLSINPSLQYYRLNYNLREEFYEAKKWTMEGMQRYTIYAGASTYALKGLHILIEALRLLKEKFPMVKLLLPGNKTHNGVVLSPNAYERYILKKIAKYNLQDNVEFIGRKNASEVADILSSVNACVVTSAMEGASATICEAMMIGTPCVCAYRGGMTDLLRDGESGYYYDFPEYAVLATRLEKLFTDMDLCKKFSNATKCDAEERHNRERNIMQLKQIYKDVIEREEKHV